jgi:hypothetical protein
LASRLLTGSGAKRLKLARRQTSDALGIASSFIADLQALNEAPKTSSVNPLHLR